MKRTLSLILTGALTLSLLAGCSNKETEESQNPGPASGTQTVTYSDTIAWDGEYDVVVVGFGGAGAVAASTAADAGAKVLLTEKAPEGHEGGNTRYSGQFCMYSHGEGSDTTVEYYKALWGDRDYTDEMLKVYADGIARTKEILVDDLGVDGSEVVYVKGGKDFDASEYPEIGLGRQLDAFTLHAGANDGYMWQQMRKTVLDRADSIDVWYESPAVKLIQDPITKVILGVVIQRDGKAVNIKATNGVILACGGFENDKEMLESYLEVTDSRAIGSIYNTGDGIRMATEVGADLWHMSVYEGYGNAGSFTFATEGDHAVVWPWSYTTLYSGSIMLAGNDGSRFLNENEEHRHGHLSYHGDFWNPLYPSQTYLVFDKAQYDKIIEADHIPEKCRDMIVEANSLEELAQATGMNADVLAKTVKDFNAAAQNGDDVFGRSKDSMTAFSNNGPYYAIRVVKAILNTQGGPRRDENAAVIDVDGNPIPHLYSAGELGGICAGPYQGAGNIAECVVFGQIAGKNAAEVKTDVASAPLVAAADNMTFVPGAVSDVSEGGPDITTADNQYLGKSGNGMGGDLYVKVTMDGEKIANVEVVEHHETDGISDPAIEQIPGAIVEANSVEVDGVSGATITSNAIKEAVTDALSQVK